jgi:PAS domain S-box-containing protein
MGYNPSRAMGVLSNGVRVLHVDDEPGFAETAATFLEREDDEFVVDTETSASEGLDRLTESDFDCIVSDYDMPEQNGIEFLKQVRREYPELPFILFTGKGSEEIASKAISAGVTDYLQKKTGTDQYTVLANRITNAVGHYQSQQALSERNQELKQYERMVNSMRDAACIYDSEGKFAVVNEYLADWYGTARNELEGTQSSLIPHIREQTNGDPYQELLNGTREELSGEIEAEFPSHGHAILEYHLTPLTSDANVEAVVGIARDITEQKRQEQDLEKYKQLVDTFPDPVAVYDLDGHYELINQAGADNHQTTPAELIGEPSPHFQRIRDDGEIDPVQALLHGDSEVIKGVYATEFSGVGERAYEYLLKMLEMDTDSRSILASFRDITERKEQQKQLQRERDRLDEFASIVAHDLQSPLSVAEGRVELARGDCRSEHLDAIDTALDRMDQIIDGVLTLAREGHDIDSEEAVSLGDAVSSMWELVAESAEGATLSYVDEDVATEQLTADYNRLRQLVENLFRNAIEHGGDDVIVTVGRTKDGFYIEDDGPGIPPDSRDEVFDVGYSTSDGGTGFGLSIVNQIVEDHGWEIEVTEGAAGGARFEITGVGFTE